MFLLGLLDFEEHEEYNITVTLTDEPISGEPLHSDYVISINILNDNDNNPIIEWDAEKVLSVSEDEINNTVIHKFTAVDKDGDTKLTFNLLRENEDIRIKPDVSMQTWFVKSPLFLPNLMNLLMDFCIVPI